MKIEGIDNDFIIKLLFFFLSQQRNNTKATKLFEQVIVWQRKECTIYDSDDGAKEFLSASIAKQNYLLIWRENFQEGAHLLP